MLRPVYCRPKASLYAVTLGEHTISDISGRELSKNIVDLKFQQYNGVTFNNDIVLLKVRNYYSSQKYYSIFYALLESFCTDC